MTEMAENSGMIRYEDLNPIEPRSESRLFKSLNNLANKIGKIVGRYSGQDTGWRLPPSESEAFAQAAKITAGSDISAALNSRVFGLAIEAVKRVEAPQEGTLNYSAYRDAVSHNYETLESEQGDSRDDG